MKVSGIGKFSVGVGILTFPFATGFAQAPPKKAVSQQWNYNQKQEYAGVTVHVGSRALTVQSDAQNTHLQAGDMPALVKQQDIEGRDVTILTATGTPIAEIGLNENAHPEKIVLGNGIKFMVVAQGSGRYKQSLFGPHGKVFSDRVADPLPRRAPDAVFLEPVAHDLGLSAAWREEITVESDGSLLIVKNKTTGDTLLYIVRSGPDRAGFLPDGTALYYDVQAQLYVGRAKHTEKYGDLQSVVPDRFIYTRDGRIGAYVWTPANNAISSFWTEQGASGTTLVHFSAGASNANSPHTASSLSVSPDGPHRTSASVDPLPHGGIFGLVRTQRITARRLRRVSRPITANRAALSHIRPALAWTARQAVAQGRAPKALPS